MSRPSSSVLIRSLTTVVCWLTALVVVGCSTTGGAPTTNQPLPTGSFVGRVAGSDAFVAVDILAENPDGTSSPGIQAYVCDGKTLLEWFQGDATNQEVQLLAGGGDVDGASVAGGATLTLDLDKRGLLGTFVSGDGQFALDVEADPASGVAGLYHFTIDPHNHLTGAAAGGATVDATYSQESETGAWSLSATFTPAPGHGAPQMLTTAVDGAPVAGNGLLIVLPDLSTRSSGGSPPMPIAPGLTRR
jgi:hypothetical protein